MPVTCGNTSFAPESETDVPTKDPRRLSLAAVPTEKDDMRKRVLSYNNSKPTEKMVIEAIRVIGNSEEKGASVAAITKWIVGNYNILDVERVKIKIKKSILKALQLGTIRRSATSKGALGASGSFVLSNKSSSNSNKKNKKSVKQIAPKQRRVVPKESANLDSTVSEE